MIAKKGVFLSKFKFNDTDPLNFNRLNLYTFDEVSQDVKFATQVFSSFHAEQSVSISNDGSYFAYQDPINSQLNRGGACFLSSFDLDKKVDISKFYVSPEVDYNSGRILFGGGNQPFHTSTSVSSVSNDANTVSFISSSSNLPNNIPSDNTLDQLYMNSGGDVTLISRSTSNDRVNRFVSSVQTSGDGEYTFFITPADNVDLIDFNSRSEMYRFNKSTELIDTVPIKQAVDDILSCESFDGCIKDIDISEDANIVVYSTDYKNLNDPTSNRFTDIIRYDFANNEHILITKKYSDNTELDNQSAHPDCSSDCNYIVYTSNGNNVIPDIFISNSVVIYDHNSRSISIVSYNLDNSSIAGQTNTPSVSDDGRYVAYAISSSFQVVEQQLNGRSHIILRDRLNETNILVSKSVDNLASNGFSYAPSVTPDGKYVIFASSSSNIVSNDSNNRSDIFIYDIANDKNYILSKNYIGDQLNGDSDSPNPSPNGKYVSFTTSATNTVPDDVNGFDDVYVIPIDHHQLLFKDTFE